MEPQEPSTELAWQELARVLDDEIQRLPARYKAAVLLCYMEGKSHAEAARQLDRPIGTVKGRLARARDLLRTRLARRGIGLSLAALTAGVAENTALAGATSALTTSAVQTAIGFAAAGGTKTSTRAGVLAEATLRAMAAAHFKIGSFLVLTVGTVVGLAFLGHRIMLAQSPAVSEGSSSSVTVPTAFAPKPASESRVRTDRFGDPLCPVASDVAM